MLIDMFLKEREIDNAIKDLGFKIISRDILLSSIPLYAVGMRDDTVFLIEVFKNGETDFINNHLLWMQNNIDNFLSKHNIANTGLIGLICLYIGDEEVDLNVPDLKGDIEIYNTVLLNEEISKFVPFDKYTVNISLIKERLDIFLRNNPGENLRKTFDDIFIKRPLVCRQGVSNVFTAETSEGKHWFYSFKSFLWYHRGGAPFYPRKVTIKA
ncbi:MAG: hypothetical protein P9M06_03255 [Candidatus Saelkia tenebricola]|nr:hypothetical protein [Candidatus Saelkia tenebricola]